MAAKWLNSRKPPKMNLQIRQTGARVQPSSKNETGNISRSTNNALDHSFGIEGANF
jgi:hypothetical protein